MWYNNKLELALKILQRKNILPFLAVNFRLRNSYHTKSRMLTMSVARRGSEHAPHSSWKRKLIKPSQLVSKIYKVTTLWQIMFPYISRSRAKVTKKLTIFTWRKSMRYLTNSLRFSIWIRLIIILVSTRISLKSIVNWIRNQILLEKYNLWKICSTQRAQFSKIFTRACSYKSTRSMKTSPCNRACKESLLKNQTPPSSGQM